MTNRSSAHTRILERVPRGSRVLEFGPSTGYMTRWMRDQLQCRVTCVEMNVESARECEPYCERMIVSDVDRLDFAVLAPEFDVVVFADVLEHLYDPWRAIRECRRIVRGKLLASIPNVGHAAVVLGLMHGRFDYGGTGLLDNTHIRFFTRSSVRALFEQNGFALSLLDGIRFDPRDTEIQLDWTRVDPAVIRSLRRNPDHDVYQFIVEAHPEGHPAPATAPPPPRPNGIRELLRDLLRRLAHGW